MPANHVLNPCRAFPLLARAAPVAAILRRGPSAWVQLIRWDTATDRLEFGQWLRGRVYERRCDLSPDGTRLIYFASKQANRDPSYTYAWTAISRPPYFTALALWPKGDCWHGGGLFLSDTRVWLNHPPGQAVPHPKHPPRGLEVAPNPLARGEDWPIFRRKLALCGWTKTQDLRYHMEGVPSPAEAEFIDYDLLNRVTPVTLPETWTKPEPGAAPGLTLVFRHYGVEWTGTPHAVEEYWLRRAAGAETRLEHVTWADWDQRGRLVFVRRGALYACEAGRPRLIANLNPPAPTRVIAPDWARR